MNNNTIGLKEFEDKIGNMIYRSFLFRKRNSIRAKYTIEMIFDDFIYLCKNKITTMNSLDLYLLIPIALGFIFGLFKGLIKELASLVAIVLGVYGAKLLAPKISNIFVLSFDFSHKTALPLSYLFVFIAVAILLLMLTRMLDKMFDSISLGGLNKMLGGFFGALKYAIIISVLLNVFDAIDSRFSILKIETKENSIAYNPLMKLAPVLWERRNEPLAPMGN